MAGMTFGEMADITRLRSKRLRLRKALRAVRSGAERENILGGQTREERLLASLNTVESRLIEYGERLVRTS